MRGLAPAYPTRASYCSAGGFFCGGACIDFWAFIIISPIRTSLKRRRRLERVVAHRLSFHLRRLELGAGAWPFSSFDALSTPFVAPDQVPVLLEHVTGTGGVPQAPSSDC